MEVTELTTCCFLQPGGILVEKAHSSLLCKEGRSIWDHCGDMGLLA